MIACSFALSGFLSGKTFPFLMQSVKIHGVLFIYAISCIIGFVFVLFVLNDTTAKSLDDDLEHTKKSQMLTSNTNEENPASVYLLKCEKNENI